MEAYTGWCFVCCFGFRQGEYVCNSWKYLETSSGRLMGTREDLLFEEYHGRNTTCLLLYWLCTRKYWRSFHVALQTLLLAGTFNNSVTCVHIIYISLPASTVSSSFISVDWQLPWDWPLLVFTSSVMTPGAYFRYTPLSLGRRWNGLVRPLL